MPPDVLHNLQVTVSCQDHQVAGFHAGQHCHSNQKRCILPNGTSASRAAVIIRAPPEAEHSPSTRLSQLQQRQRAQQFRNIVEFQVKKDIKTTLLKFRTNCGPNNVNISLPTFRRQSVVRSCRQRTARHHDYDNQGHNHRRIRNSAGRR